MKHADFYPGLLFQTAIGRWKCTDVGQRTVTAIHLEAVHDDPARHPDPDHPRWSEGPPYGLAEQVLDESDIANAFRTWDEAIETGVDRERTLPSAVVDHCMRRRFANVFDPQAAPAEVYPQNALKGFRQRQDETLRAHAAHRGPDGEWQIEYFSFQRQALDEMPESAWRALPLSFT
jgi:hypothetical protein